MKERTMLVLATSLMGGLLLLAIIACGTSTPSAETKGAIGEQAAKEQPLLKPTSTPSAETKSAIGEQIAKERPLLKPTSSLERCYERHDIGLAAVWISPGPRVGSGVLEQRILEKDFVVWAELVDAKFKAVESKAIKFELKGLPSVYETYKYALLGEVDLRIHEYLKGEGPDLITAVIEGQIAFNSLEDMDCAIHILTKDVGQLFSSKEGIALLESTLDSEIYYMGRAHENFGGKDRHHSTWLPYKDESFNNRGSDGWISLAEVRRRVSSVLEEYNRRSDKNWHDCVFYKYYYKDWDPWAYQGVFGPYEDYRDHTVIFNGEDVPVPAGTMVWVSPDRYYTDDSGRRLDIISRSMSLEGGYADLFEATYHTDYEFTANEWRGSPGDKGPHYEAIWHKNRNGKANQFQMTTAALVVTTVEDLEEGEYTFNFKDHIKFDGHDPVDCGQDDGGPRLFKVIVDKDRIVGE